MMMFVLGMLAWQVVTAVVYIVSDNDEKGAICGGGICALILMGAGAIIRKVRLHNSRKYNLYQFFGKDGDWIANYYMTEKVAERFNLIDRNAHPITYCVRLYRAGYEYKCIPPKNEILTAEMIENGIPGMSKDFFEKFFKNA